MGFVLSKSVKFKNKLNLTGMSGLAGFIVNTFLA